MHVLPIELEMLERFMKQYRKVLSYLDENDDVTMRVSLNLSPRFTDWENSEWAPADFVDRFNKNFYGIKHINEIRWNDSLKGTTQQKRESIELDYDQFVFCDPDILVHEQLLKTQLQVSYEWDGDMYIVSPSLPQWWDHSWDALCHSEFKDKPYGYSQTEECVSATLTQDVSNVKVKTIPMIKFGCGMHTLYSKSFWKLAGIPESFGGYGPEDTYGMRAAMIALKFGYNITQFMIDGIYITEDISDRIPSYNDKLTLIDNKSELSDDTESKVRIELVNFSKKLSKI